MTSPAPSRVVPVTALNKELKIDILNSLFYFLRACSADFSALLAVS